jgi:hypothetical protein
MIKNLKPTSMTTNAFRTAISITPKAILSANSKLAKDGIQNITMPSYHGWYLHNGNLTEQITCPSAGTCKAICYASGNTYGFSNSMIKHGRNLNYVMNKPFEFADQLIQEITVKTKNPKFRAIRWHDAGDIFSEGYWGVMKAVMNALPNVQFYAYSKQVSFIKEKQKQGDIPSNFSVIFSFGGKEDHLIDTHNDRHAKVFHNRASLRQAGYSDGTNTDRLAANPSYKKIGLIVHGNWLALPKLRNMVKRIG